MVVLQGEDCDYTLCGQRVKQLPRAISVSILFFALRLEDQIIALPKLSELHQAVRGIICDSRCRLRANHHRIPCQASRRSNDGLQEESASRLCSTVLRSGRIPRNWNAFLNTAGAAMTSNPFSHIFRIEFCPFTLPCNSASLKCREAHIDRKTLTF